ASVKPEAYQLYLKGRYFLDRRDPAALQKALDYFRQSAAQDANFARAWASVALSYELLEYVRAISPANSYPNALLAARQAVQIDPGSSESAYGNCLHPRALRMELDGGRSRIDAGFDARSELRVGASMVFLRATASR